MQGEEGDRAAARVGGLPHDTYMLRYSRDARYWPSSRDARYWPGTAV